MTSRTYVLSAFVGSPWAILPEKLVVLEEIVARHVRGEKLSKEEIEARVHGASRPVQQQVNSVAVLPLFGTIFPRANMMTEYSGATSAEDFGADFDKLLNSPNIDAIVIDVNSPGGSVYGVEEVSQKIFDARGVKPIIAVANHLMASAAYWIASSAQEIVVTPSSDVGSIGVFAVHEDMSKMLEQAGLNVTLISAGKYKVEGNPYQPLSQEAIDAIQASVNETYDAFVRDVARNRGVSVETVRNGFGQGRVVSANDAINMKMADRIGTLDGTVTRLFGGGQGTEAKAEGGRHAAPSSGSDEVDSSLGQEPETDQSTSPMQEARARLEMVANKFQGDDMNSKFVRELLRERSEKVARAQALVETADKEERDLTDAERTEFEQMLSEAEAMDPKIEKIQLERERLRNAAEKKFIGGNSASNEDPQKPDGQGSNRMKRADFDKLTPGEQSTFMKNGGKIED